MTSLTHMTPLVEEDSSRPSSQQSNVSSASSKSTASSDNSKSGLLSISTITDVITKAQPEENLAGLIMKLSHAKKSKTETKPATDSNAGETLAQKPEQVQSQLSTDCQMEDRKKSRTSKVAVSSAQSQKADTAQLVSTKDFRKVKPPSARESRCQTVEGQPPSSLNPKPPASSFQRSYPCLEGSKLRHEGSNEAHKCKEGPRTSQGQTKTRDQNKPKSQPSMVAKHAPGLKRPSHSKTSSTGQQRGEQAQRSSHSHRSSAGQETGDHAQTSSHSQRSSASQQRVPQARRSCQGQKANLDKKCNTQPSIDPLKLPVTLDASAPERSSSRSPPSQGQGKASRQLSSAVPSIGSLAPARCDHNDLQSPAGISSNSSALHQSGTLPSLEQERTPPKKPAEQEPADTRHEQPRRISSTPNDASMTFDPASTTLSPQGISVITSTPNVLNTVETPTADRAVDFVKVLPQSNNAEVLQKPFANAEKMIPERDGDGQKLTLPLEQEKVECLTLTSPVEHLTQWSFDATASTVPAVTSGQCLG